MQRMTLNTGKWHRATVREFAVLAIFLAGSFPAGSLAQQPGQKTFPSAEEASNSLVAAMQSKNEKALLAFLGPDGKEIVSSGDEIEDLHTRADFVQRYLEMHRLVNEPDGTTVLYIGARNWPTPIPLVHNANGWYFDTEAGKREILYRRIGRNEMSAIRVCQELAAAEHEYHDAQHSQYAQAIYSDEGQHNGLYWKVAAGESHRTAGGERCRSRLRAREKRHSHSLSRLLLPDPDDAGETRPGRRKAIHRRWQDDRGICFRGLSGGIPLIRRDDVHRRERRSGISAGSRQSDRRDCRLGEDIQSGFHLEKS